MSTNDTLSGREPCPYCRSTTGACDYSFPHPRTGATVKDCLTVRKAYVVYADNGNVICFSTDRQHHSILSLEEKGYPVVVLAEPVAGVVVLPDRKPMPDPAAFPGGPTARCWVHAEAQHYNQALDDVAALNGGAADGQSDACTCKPPESERGGE